MLPGERVMRASAAGRELFGFKCHETGDNLVVLAGNKLKALARLQEQWPNYTFIACDAGGLVLSEYGGVAMLGTELSELASQGMAAALATQSESEAVAATVTPRIQDSVLVNVLPATPAPIKKGK